MVAPTQLKGVTVDSFIVRTTQGDMDSLSFLEELLEQVWPYAADDVNFSLLDGENATLSVTYVIQPFGVEKTIDYQFSLTSTELRMGCLGTEHIDDGEADITALAEHIDSEVYEDFRSEIW